MRYTYVGVILILMLSACAAPTVKEHMLTTRRFSPTTNVQTLISWPTNRKYVEIAELKVSGGEASSDQEIIDALLAKAKELGADAIVWGAKRNRGSTQVPTEGPIIIGDDVEIKSRAVAIKYLP